MDAQPRGLGRVEKTDDVRMESLRGDVADLILQEMRDAKSALPWTTRSEREQQQMIDRCQAFAKQIIRRVVDILVAGDDPAIEVSIDKWGVNSKGALQISLLAVGSKDNKTILVEQGTMAYLVFADHEEGDGERDKISPTKDQGDLLDDGEAAEPEGGEAAEEDAGDPEGGQPEPGDTTEDDGEVKDPPLADEPKGPKPEPEVEQAKKRGRKDGDQ